MLPQSFTIVDGVNSLASLTQAFGGDFDLTGYPNSLSGGPVVDSFDSIAISSSSAQRRGAWAFVKYLLQPDIQRALWANEYFPIRRDVFAQILSGAAYPGSDARSSLSTNYETPVSKSMTAQIQTIVEQAHRCAYTGSVVAEIIQENAAPYFAGNQSAEDTARLIQSGVSIYLAEQQ